MSAQATEYSQDFQQFLELVEKSLIQAAEDAQLFAKRTGTSLVVRENSQTSEPTADNGNIQ